MIKVQEWRERESRSATWIRALVIGEDGRKIPAFISNVSSRGGRITSAEGLTTGERIRIVVPGLGSTLANVRWVRDGHAGAEFIPGSDVWIIQRQPLQVAGDEVADGLRGGAA